MSDDDILSGQVIHLYDDMEYPILEEEPIMFFTPLDYSDFELPAEEYHMEYEYEESIREPVLTDAEIRDIKAAFQIFDTDADGCINVKNVRDILKKLSICPSKKQVERVMGAVADSKKTCLDLCDFLNLITQMYETADTEDKIREAFQVFDDDKDGFISPEILRNTLTSIGDILTDEEVDHLILTQDINDNGLIDIEKFVRLICDMKLGQDEKEEEGAAPSCDITPSISLPCSVQEDMEKRCNFNEYL